jgi:hypothetical protein
MNDSQIDDLKQFIDGKISQSESRLSEKIENAENGLRKEMKDGFSGVADSLETTNQILDEHEHRIAKLEQKAA